MAKDGGKRTASHHKCPPLPQGGSFHGPWLDDHDTVESANKKWNSYLRAVSRLQPLPRRTR